MNEFTITINDEQKKEIISEVTRNFKEAIDEAITESLLEAKSIRHVTKKELAEILSTSTNTISMFEKNGLPVFRFNKVVRYNVQKVDEWLQEYYS